MPLIGSSVDPPLSLNLFSTLLFAVKESQAAINAICYADIPARLERDVRNLLIRINPEFYMQAIELERSHGR